MKVTIGGKTVWLLREISSGDGWAGKPLEAHFGLGDATNITMLQVEWPSGIVQAFANVDVRRAMLITEPARLAIQSPDQVLVQSWPGQAFLVENSTNLLSWSGVFSITNSAGSLQFAASAAGGVPARFYRVRAQ